MVPFTSMNIAFTSYLPASNKSNVNSAWLKLSSGVIVAFCLMTTPLALETIIVTSPSCFPGIVTVMVLFTFTNTLSASTFSSPSVANTSNEVLFSLSTYLSSPRYSAVTLYNPITGLSRCSRPLPSFTYTVYDLMSSVPFNSFTITLPVASIGTSIVMLTSLP